MVVTFFLPFVWLLIWFVTSLAVFSWRVSAFCVVCVFLHWLLACALLVVSFSWFSVLRVLLCYMVSVFPFVCFVPEHLEAKPNIQQAAAQYVEFLTLRQAVSRNGLSRLENRSGDASNVACDHKEATKHLLCMDKANSSRNCLLGTLTPFKQECRESVRIRSTSTGTVKHIPNNILPEVSRYL